MATATIAIGLVPQIALAIRVPPRVAALIHVARRAWPRSKVTESQAAKRTRQGRRRKRAAERVVARAEPLEHDQAPGEGRAAVYPTIAAEQQDATFVECKSA